MKKFGFLTKLLTVAMVVLMCLNPAVVAFSNIASAAADDNLMYFHGDLNSDDKINAFDYILVKRHCLKTITLNEEQLLRGDVNQSGEIDKFDYILIKRHCLKTYTIGKIEICKHDIENIPAADATCTEDGNIAYYRCTECEKLYSDADAKNEITLESTVVSAIGHAEKTVEGYAPTYDETGLTSGIQCSVCEKWIEEQEIIPKLDPIEHNITYYDEKTPGYPKYETYKEHLGLDSLPALEKDGYKFLGWYTELEGGSRVAFIPKNSKEDYLLYAHWETIKYTITYFDAAKNTNQTTYTVEDEFYLTDPIWAGLSFDRWTDKNGNSISKIAKGTFGNIELTANWKSIKNMAVASGGNSELLTVYDDTSERYHFIYEIGSIQNVILDTLYTYKYDGTSNYSYSFSETVGVEESVGNNIAQTIGQTIMQSTDWSKTTEWIEKNSTTTQQEATFCPELEIKGVKAKIFEKSNGSTNFEESSYSEANCITTSNGTEIENSSSVSSTLSFVKNTTTTVTKTISLSPETSPAGIYNYVFAGDIRVYAIVTYDPTSENYYIDIYSLVYRTFDTTIFELAPEFNLNVDLISCSALSFDVPVDGIDAYIASSYYIQYDANGGVGEKMPMSVHKINDEQTLSLNGYSKSGYYFDGWKYTTDEGSIELYDGQTVKNLASPGETITLYAIWKPSDYTVSFDATGGTVSQKTKDVTFDGTYGALPVPERTGYTFECWMLDGKKITSDSIVITASAHTLDAKWKPNTFTIKYNANGGNGTTADTYHTYDITSHLALNRFSRDGYTFAGWSWRSDAQTPDYTNGHAVINMTSTANETITLYAVWAKSTAFKGFYSRAIELTKGQSYTDFVSTGMNKDALIACGYTSLKLTITLQAKENAWIVYNGAVLNIESGGLYCANADWGTFYNTSIFGNGWAQETKTLTVPLNALNSTCDLSLVWSAANSIGTDNDGWYLGTVEITIVAQ